MVTGSMELLKGTFVVEYHLFLWYLPLNKSLAKIQTNSKIIQKAVRKTLAV